MNLYLFHYRNNNFETDLNSRPSFYILYYYKLIIVGTYTIYLIGVFSRCIFIKDC